MIRFFAILALLFIASTQAEVRADVLKGTIQQNNANVRLARPNPVRQITNDFSLKQEIPRKAPSVGDVLDTRNFSAFTRAIQGTTDGANKGLVIAWEQWHKAICQNIYQQWKNENPVPGSAAVLIKVSRFGNVSFSVQNLFVNGYGQQGELNRQAFMEAVNRSVDRIDRRLLRFPAGSQRNEVVLTATFAHSDQEYAPDGFDWKRNDFEQIGR